jgi:hypothetical protein
LYERVKFFSSEKKANKDPVPSLLLSLDPADHLVKEVRIPKPTNIFTIFHWLSIVISPDTAVALSHDPSSGRLTFYVCSNSFHDAAMSNATRLLDIIRRTLAIASEGGNYYDQKDEYLDFVTDVCWHRLQDKIRKVPRFPPLAVPGDADVSTISSILNTIFGLLDAWNTWRVHSGLPDKESPKRRRETRTLPAAVHRYSEALFRTSFSSTR